MLPIKTTRRSVEPIPLLPCLTFNAGRGRGCLDFLFLTDVQVWKVIWNRDLDPDQKLIMASMGQAPNHMPNFLTRLQTNCWIMLVAGLNHHGGNNKSIPSNSETWMTPGERKGGGGRGSWKRTRKDGRKSWRWMRRVRVTAVMKSSEWKMLL